MRGSLAANRGVRTMKQREEDGGSKKLEFVPPKIVATYDRKELEESIRPHLDIPAYG